MSQTNVSDVQIWSQHNMTVEATVVSLVISRNTTSQVHVFADASVTETQGSATPIGCWIAFDGERRDRRDFTLSAREETVVAVSSAVEVPAGTYTVALRCQRQNGLTEAIPVVPAGRARLTVLSG